MLTQYYPPEIGAAQSRLEYYANYFRTRNHQVTVLTTFPNYPQGKIFDAYRNRFFSREVVNGIEIIRTWLWQDDTKTGVARLKWFLSFMISSFLAALRIKKPDIILVENPPLFSGVTANLVKLFKRVPVVNHLSDMWVDAAVDFGFLKKPWQIQFARRLERYVLTYCDGIVSVTDAVYRHALSFKDPSRVRLLPNGVDTTVYRKKPLNETVRKKFGLSDKFVICYAGTMGFQHGLDTILEAATLLHTNGDEYRFLFIGDGSEKERIRQLAQQRHIDNVIFIDAQPQTELVEYLNASNIGISTLKDAPFTKGVRPVKIFSYMACELPVIATDIGESGMLIKEAGCGIAVPPENPRSIADAIIQLHQNIALSAEFGKHGRQFVEEHYTREKSAHALLDFLASISANKIAAA